MAVTVAALQAVLSAHTADFDKGMDRSETRMHKVGKTAAVAGGIIATGLGIGLKKSTDAAKEAQVAQITLESALTSAGIAVGAHTKAIDANIQRTSKLAALDDEDLSNAFAKLVRTTGSVTKATQGMNLAADIARARHISLEAATKIVEKAMIGQTRGLKSVGVELDKGATATEAIAKAQKQFAGSAEAYGKSSAAASERAAVATENLEESLGKVLLPTVTAVTGKLATMAEFLTKHSTVTKILVGSLGALAAVLLTVGAATRIYAAAQVVIRAATVAWTAAQWLLNAALTANPIGVVVVALAALVAGLILAWKHSETFRKIVTAVFDAVAGAAEAVLGFFQDHWKTIALLISGPFLPLVALATDAFGIRSKLIGAGQAVISFFTGNWKTIAVLIAGPFAPLVALATDAFGIRSKTIAAFEGIRSAVSEKMAAVVGAIRDFFGQAVTVATSLGEKIKAGLANGLTGIGTEAAQAFQRVMGAVRDFVEAAFNAGKDVGSAILRGFRAGLAGIGDAITGLVKGPINALIRAWNAIEIPGFHLHIPGLKVLGRTIIPDINFGFDSIGLPDIATLAEGGIVKQPTLALIAERGPEAVVPLARHQQQPLLVTLELDGMKLTQVLIDPIRNQIAQIERRNARGAFG